MYPLLTVDTLKCLTNLPLSQAPPQMCWGRAREQGRRLNVGQMNTFLETIMHTENCLDRHAEKDPNRVALIWEKNEPNQQEKVTYRYSASMIKHRQSCRLYNKWEIAW